MMQSYHIKRIGHQGNEQKLMQNVKRYLKLIQQKRFQNVVDDIHNMNPLDKSVNRSLGSQIAYLIKNLDYGTVLRNFKMVDQKNL